MSHQRFNDLLNELYWDICIELEIDIKERCRQVKYISGRNIFIYIISKLGDLDNDRSQHRAITTTSIGAYLGLHHTSVIAIRQKSWVFHDRACHACYKVMSDKYLTVQGRANILFVQRDYHLNRAAAIQKQIKELKD